MGVYIRSDSPYYWMWLEGYRDPRGRRLRERLNVRHDAPTPALRRENRQLAELAYFGRMRELARLDAVPEKKPGRTFAAQAAWFTEQLLPQRKGREREAEILPRLVAVFGQFSLKAVTPERVNEYWITPRLSSPTVIATKKYTKGRAVAAGPSTINREVEVLKAVLQSAVPQYLAASPIYGMKRLRTITPRRRILSEDEESRLLEVMDVDDKALFLLALDSLVRMGDALDLRREDVQGDGAWIADPKAGGGFYVPLSRRTQRALAAIPDDRTGYFFTRRRHGGTEKKRRSAVRIALRRYCRAARVAFGKAKGGVTFHWATRRTGATRMLTRGIDIGTVQKVGRWAGASVVLGIYHSLLDDKAKAAVEAVGQLEPLDETRAGRTDALASESHPPRMAHLRLLRLATTTKS